MPSMQDVLLKALAVRLFVGRCDPLLGLAVLLCGAGLAGTLSLQLQPASAALLPMSSPIAATELSLPVPTANENLDRFYATLGEERYVEQQVKTLFALAEKSELVIKQADYKLAFDAASGVASYQIVMPVKGAATSIWQFSLLALQAMPFAALDELTFKRDSITDDEPEAQLRFTLFLHPAAKAGRP